MNYICECVCVCVCVCVRERERENHTNEVSRSGSQVLSPDGNLGPGRALVGGDARDQRWLPGARHGGLGHVGPQEGMVTWITSKRREAG